jgi:hypothetical protein
VACGDRPRRLGDPHSQHPPRSDRLLPRCWRITVSHPQGLWSSKSVAQGHADMLRMLSKVDWHFHGRCTSQIDDYRIGIVTYLANSLEMASSHAASLETKRRIRRDRRAQWLALRAWRWTKRRFERGQLSLSLPAEPQRA